MKRLLAWLSTAATLTFTVPVIAGQDDPRLGPLFETLKTTPSEAEAQMIEQAIWQLWHISGTEAVDGLMVRGLNAMATGDHGRALAAFDEMVGLAPEFAEAWNKRATIHYLIGEYRKSINDIERTLALEPRHFGALSGLGLVYLALDREERALEAFEAALKIHAHLPGAETNIKALHDKLKGKGI